MPSPLSPLESLALPALERIALHLVRSSFLGPPADLLPLLSTSRTLHDALSFAKNEHLWGRLFAFKFDTKAISRRHGSRWTTSGCLGQEGRKRFAAMKRIRHGVVAEQHHLSDLWTAYLMMLEDDGNNEAQLVEWANIRHFLYLVVSFRARAPLGSSCSWFQDTEGTALTVWLLWMTANPGELLGTMYIGVFSGAHIEQKI